jgi:hypothetical protein
MSKWVLRALAGHSASWIGPRVWINPIRSGDLPIGCLHRPAMPLRVFGPIEGDVQLAHMPYVQPSSLDALAANPDDSRQDVDCA